MHFVLVISPTLLKISNNRAADEPIMAKRRVQAKVRKVVRIRNHGVIGAC